VYNVVLYLVQTVIYCNYCFHLLIHLLTLLFVYLR